MTLSLIGLPSVTYANETDRNQGLPDTEAGGSRSGSVCSSQDPLLAFVPSNHILKTTESQTTLWFYLPDSEVLTNAELIVYDEDSNPVVDTSFSVAEQSGLFGVNLSFPGEGDKLDVGKDYRWYFSLICPDDRAADISVDGWVQATTLSSDFTNTLNSASPAEQANLYVQEGLWSEAVLLLISAPHLDTAADGRLDLWNSIIQAISPVSIPLNFATASQFDIPSTLY